MIKAFSILYISLIIPINGAVYMAAGGNAVLSALCITGILSLLGAIGIDKVGQL